MKIVLKLVTPLIAVAMMTSVSSSTLAQSSQTGSQQNSTAPVAAQNTKAFQDGVQGAQLDKMANRKIDAKSSFLYTHPPVKKGDRDAYQASFEAGYNSATQQGSNTAMGK